MNPEPQKSNYSEYIRIISKDGHTFVLPKQVAIEMSKTLNDLLNNSMSNNEPITLQLFTKEVLENVFDYLFFRKKYLSSNTSPPEYPHIDPSIVLDVMLASLYLRC